MVEEPNSPEQTLTSGGFLIDPLGIEVFGAITPVREPNTLLLLLSGIGMTLLFRGRLYQASKT